MLCDDVLWGQEWASGFPELCPAQLRVSGAGAQGVRAVFTLVSTSVWGLSISYCAPGRDEEGQE